MITRRQVIVGTTLAGLCAGRAGAQDADPNVALYHRAAQEGRVTWYIAQISSTEAEHMGAMFTARYPAIHVDIVRATGQVIYQRLSQDLRAGAHNCDVFGSTDLGQYITLGRANRLAVYEPAAEPALRPLFRDYDPSHRIHVTNNNLTTIVSHTKIQIADSPKTWLDLADPKWKGQLALAHPAYSGAMGAWVYLMAKIHGWSYFEQLARNKPQIGRSLIDPTITIVSGERMVGIAPSDLVLDQAARGNPVRNTFPEDGSVVTVGPTSILQDAPHPNAARLFVEWLLGPDASAYAAQEHRLPVRADVAPEQSVRTPEQVKVIQAPAEELEAGVPAIIEQWRDTFGV